MSIQNWYVVHRGQDGHAELEGEIDVAGERIVIGLRITNWAGDYWERVLCAYLNGLEGVPSHPAPTYEQADAVAR